MNNSFKIYLFGRAFGNGQASADEIILNIHDDQSATRTNDLQFSKDTRHLYDISHKVVPVKVITALQWHVLFISDIQCDALAQK